MRTLHLTGYFLRPGDRGYTLVAKATGTKDKQDVYWFREMGGDMMWDEFEASTLPTNKDAVVDIISEAVVDKKGKGKSAGEKEICVEHLRKMEAGSREVTESSPRTLQVDEVDDISVAMPQEAQELAHALKLSEGTTSNTER
jgi:hypothetical protein